MENGEQLPNYSTPTPAPNLPAPVSYLHQPRSLHRHQNLTRNLPAARLSSWPWSSSANWLLLILLFFLRRWWRRRSQAARQPGPALMHESWYNPIPLIEQESGVAGSPSKSMYNLQTSPSSKLAQLRETSGRSSYAARPEYRLDRGSGSVGPSSRTDDVNYSEGVNSSSLEVKSRLPPGVSPQWIIENDAVLVIQHEDAEAAPIQEIPPPYIFAGPRPSMHSTSSLS